MYFCNSHISISALTIAARTASSMQSPAYKPLQITPFTRNPVQINIAADTVYTARIGVLPKIALVLRLGCAIAGNPCEVKLVTHTIVVVFLVQVMGDIASNLRRTLFTQFIGKSSHSMCCNRFLLGVHSPEKRDIVLSILPEHTRLFTGFILVRSNAVKVHAEANAALLQLVRMEHELLIFLDAAACATITGAKDNQGCIRDKPVIINGRLVFTDIANLVTALVNGYARLLVIVGRFYSIIEDKCLFQALVKLVALLLTRAFFLVRVVRINVPIGIKPDGGYEMLNPFAFARA